MLLKLQSHYKYIIMLYKAFIKCEYAGYKLNEGFKVKLFWLMLS